MAISQLQKKERQGSFHAKTMLHESAYLDLALGLGVWNEVTR